MNGGAFRLPDGGRIDRSKTIDFTFNGKSYSGFDGDTLASALLANGVRIVGRSFKYHRPRGILSASAQEPNALVQMESGAYSLPNLKATRVELYEGLAAASVNCWPSVGLDAGTVNDLVHRLIPAGFYYKTFMWPQRGWHFYEQFIRRMAGFGKAPDGSDPDRYERMNVHCDVLVVGAGASGLAAAHSAGLRGNRVLLVDDGASLGGGLLDSRREEASHQWLLDTTADLEAMENVRILTRTTVTGYYEHNFLIALERVTDHLGPRAPDHLPRQRLWRIRAGRVILAAGAHERPLLFANNDRPGVMLAGAVQTYVNRFAVRPGKCGAIVTNNDSAYAVARDLILANVGLAVLVDLRAGASDGKKANDLRRAGVEVLTGHVVVNSAGRRGIRAIQVAPLEDDGEIGGPTRKISCDFLAMSGGWSPVVHLFSQSRGKLRWDERLGAVLPDAPAQPVTCVGAANGYYSTADCIRDGEAAGNGEVADIRRTEDVVEKPLRLVPVPEEAAQGRSFIDFQNDVTAGDIKLAVREGYHSVEHLKRYTTLGMGTDQGKTGNVVGMAILAEHLHLPISQVGTTTFRPPFSPLTFGAVAGRDSGDLADPIRRTPMHPWHEETGAVFENVGQWKRPFWYPRDRESKDEAVARECNAVRNRIGIMDVTTLGKIMLQGPDAVTLLNRVYTNAWSKLEIGRCRYGLMLGEDGMVMDDGVTARLAEEKFLMTTTTGNAAQVMAWLEEWLQTEWPELKVFLTSVTEQFATAAVAGPQARDLVGRLTQDIDMSAESFPFMSWRTGHVAGLPSRVFRISYTGELSYEISVPARHGLALWTALYEAGQDLGITPFGTEAMHVLRAEKGFIMIGQETDGSVNPQDLEMHWILSKRKDFIGRRSLSRNAMLDPMRKRLVGLKTTDPSVVLPEGGQILEAAPTSLPATMIGHVTSSYRSETLGRSIALALVKGGRERKSGTVVIELDNGSAEAEICEPCFYDPEGLKLHG